MLFYLSGMEINTKMQTQAVIPNCMWDLVCHWREWGYEMLIVLILLIIEMEKSQKLVFQFM